MLIIKGLTTLLILKLDISTSISLLVVGKRKKLSFTGLWLKIKYKSKSFENRRKGDFS